MKTVLIVTSGFPLFKKEGINEFMLEFADSMAKEFNVLVLAPYSKGSKRYEEWGNLKIYRHNQFPFVNAELAYGNGIVNNIKKNPFLVFSIPFFFLLQILAIKKIVSLHKVDVIHAHWIIPQGVSSILYKKIFEKKIKIIATIHGSDFLDLNNWFFKKLKNWCLFNVDQITVVGAHIKEQIEKQQLKIPPVILAPMGISTIKFSPEKRDRKLHEELQIKGEFLLFVGNCIPEKGISELVLSMPNIIKAFPSAVLVVIGQGVLLEQLQTMAKQLGVAANIRFMGALASEKLPGYFASADAFILPSYSEGYSLVVREALSSETPVIVSDIETFNSGELSNLVFKLKKIEPNDIAEMVKSVLKGNDKLEEMKKKGRIYVQQNDDVSTVHRIYFHLVKSL
ncbi:MAG: glycosyltransferase family 4 protein [Bacteroidota bacterium]|nr:glycosyltransferase family 4 protein [Bacteroidota bacterium]